MTTGVGAGLAFGFAERGVATLLAYVIATRVLRLARPSVGAMMVCAGIANTGYLGVPLARTLFDDRQAVGQAITYDVVVSATFLLLVAFAIGAAFGTLAGETPRERVRAFVVRNPPLAAFLLALVAPAAWSPDWAKDAAEVAVLALAPLGFFALGVNLMQEQEDGVRVFPPPMTAPVAVTLGLRLLVAPAVMALLSLTVVKVPPAFLLQSGMACGINSLAVAHIYGLDLRITAAAIAWSTAIVLSGGGDRRRARRPVACRPVRALVQRVSRAAVRVDGEVAGSIGPGPARAARGDPRGRRGDLRPARATRFARCASSRTRRAG